MNLDEFTKQTRMESEKPSGWAYDFEGMKAYEKERMKSAEEFSMGILDEERKVTEEGLKTDKLFLDATKIAYKQMYGKMLEGSEEEIASQGMQLVSDALMPLTTVDGAGMLGIYKHFNEAHPEAKQALYYMIDSIDKKDMTFDGFMRGVKSIGKDPTTYSGVGLSYSFFGKTAAKSSAKKELMKMLGEASLVGGAYMGVEEGLRQDLQGKQDLGEIATQAGIGAVAGPVMVGGVKALGVGGKKALTGVADFMQNTEQEMMRMAGGGTPPQEFYSVAQEAINAMPNKMSGSDFKNYLLKKGVKQDELTHSGIEEAFSKDVITKQEAMDMMNNPTLNKVTLGRQMSQIRMEMEDKYKTDKFYPLMNDAEKERYNTAVNNQDLQKYQKYSTEDIDGTNYREELTTVGKGFSADEIKLNNMYDEIANNPKKYSDNSDKYKEYLSLKQKVAEDKTGKRIVEADGKNGVKFLHVREDNTVAKEFDTLDKAVSDLHYQSQDMNKADFQSSHWDEANVLYHTRKQDTTIDGDKTLLVEEIQSDWHQKGRKVGYDEGKTYQDYKKEMTDEKVKSHLHVSDEKWNNLKYYEKDGHRETYLYDMGKRTGEGIPQAPYAKTWHEKAMKDTISEAVDKGYDRVAWVVGKTQADRYSLAKQVDEIGFKKNNDGTYFITIKGKNGDIINNMPTAKEEKLSEFVGKEMAEKIIETEKSRKPTATGMSYARGLDLEVGGEGMKGFYDKILPDFTSKYIKKYDSSLEKKKLKNGDEVLSFKVTDKMKKDIKEKGQPLYSVGGVVAGASIAKDDNE